MEKIAVVLIDTYSAKLIIAGSKKQDTYEILDRETEQINLGLEQEDYFLKKPQIDDCIRVFKDFRKICDMYETKKIIAIANFDEDTKPKNIYSFFDEVFATCGFRFTMLTDNEQNNYIYMGVINTYDMPKGTVVSLTSNSLHLVEYNRRNVVNSVAMHFGPVTLLRMYPIAELGVKTAFQKMEKYIETQLSDAAWIGEMEEEFSLIGSGMGFTDLSKMIRKFIKYPLDKDDCFVANFEDTEKIYEQLKTLDISASKRLKGIDEPRADIFVASLAIIMGIFKASKRNQINIVERGFAEGLILAEFVPTTFEKPISDVLGFGISNNLVDLEQIDLEHNEQVYNLSILLFKQLRVLHKLPRGYVKILRIASVLYNVGKRINNINFSKYSYDVILGLDIFGADHREQVLAAFVASLAEGAEISLTEWVKYKSMFSEEDFDAIKKLGVIVALASSFDKTKDAQVVDINCDILGDSVIMKTVTVSNADYLIRQALNYQKEFEKNFHKKLEIL